jgi:hypothetical protein
VHVKRVKGINQMVALFGIEMPSGGDITPIVKFDARAGRMFKMQYNHDTREKMPVDITSPAPKFAIDFGSLEVGYGCFTATGPDLRVVPMGQSLPSQPSDRDDKGSLKFRPIFRVKLYGKVLDGLREWASSAKVVMESVHDLYNKFLAAQEATTGKIPIVELTSSIPVIMGKGARQTTAYAPKFAIVGWAERVPELGDRTVPSPKGKTNGATTGTQADPFTPDSTQEQVKPAPGMVDELNDVIPF